MNKFERVSSNYQQMSLAGESIGVMSEGGGFPALMSRGDCTGGGGLYRDLNASLLAC